MHRRGEEKKKKRKNKSRGENTLEKEMMDQGRIINASKRNGVCLMMIRLKKQTCLISGRFMKSYDNYVNAISRV